LILTGYWKKLVNDFVITIHTFFFIAFIISQIVIHFFSRASTFSADFRVIAPPKIRDSENSKQLSERNIHTQTHPLFGDFFVTLLPMIAFHGMHVFAYESSFSMPNRGTIAYVWEFLHARFAKTQQCDDSWEYNPYRLYLSRSIRSVSSKLDSENEQKKRSFVLRLAGDFCYESDRRRYDQINFLFCS
jgi:hypothetical protein